MSTYVADASWNLIHCVIFRLKNTPSSCTIQEAIGAGRSEEPWRTPSLCHIGYFTSIAGNCVAVICKRLGRGGGEKGRQGLSRENVCSLFILVVAWFLPSYLSFHLLIFVYLCLPSFLIFFLSFLFFFSILLSLLLVPLLFSSLSFVIFSLHLSF